MSMLICGVANPRGEGDDYNGLYLKDSEIDEVVASREMVGIPVKVEHKGIGVGRVVSAFKDLEGRLNCVMEIERDELEGAIAQRWVNDNTASELSLGYVVDINQTKPGCDGGLKAGKKKILEVSLVRKGARDGCHIYSHARRKAPRLDGRDVIKDWHEAFGLE